jgi:hypothetical protein
MSERDDLVKDLAQSFLSSVIKDLDAQLLDQNEWDKTELLLDVCVECISRLHTAHKVMFPNLGNQEWLAEQILEELTDKLAIDGDDISIIHVN